MIKLCENCGKIIDENSNFCGYCGFKTNNYEMYTENSYYQESQLKNNGKGLSIAGMVLGIYSIITVIRVFISIGNLKNEIKFVYYFSTDLYVYILIRFILGVIPSIVGICLSSAGMKRQKSGFNESGLVLSIIALILYSISIFYMISLIK